MARSGTQHALEEEEGLICESVVGAGGDGRGPEVGIGGGGGDDAAEDCAGMARGRGGDDERGGGADGEQHAPDEGLGVDMPCHLRIHLAVDEAQPRPKPLHSSGVAGAVDILALPDSRRDLPDPAMTFHWRTLKGSIDFTLFRNSSRDGEDDKVVTMDHTGCTLICDTGVPAATVYQLPSMAKPNFSPGCLTVGGGLFVIDALPSSTRSFEALFLEDGDGLKPTDCASHLIKSYTVAGGSNILISNKGAQIYCFDTVEGTWSKAGNWALPFCRLAERADDTPVIHGLWQEYMEPPKRWNLIRSCTVHMGLSKFCIVRHRSERYTQLQKKLPCATIRKSSSVVMATEWMPMYPSAAEVTIALNEMFSLDDGKVEAMDNALIGMAGEGVDDLLVGSC
ncbi:hypothetical protein BAE44_0003721 [Dichanthelium oligosanthes]|uniref:Uncharacterized protein n=1 Tax=Dichanthelium oligosanthes TaxID=888268 RepID=A0A1E5WDF3_9POAL|nr:hypothetical protein BAE44_0003721 [Dichanthelium oligosanthes]